ncbi:MAG: type II toxin-antitoxin system Phd/YefM family antitoxin [Kiritimatiellae bacterium]|nr:type II toxin-antitoxin system Phd/YefM family antitoxin [Kiritimatiellia bacterium]
MRTTWALQDAKNRLSEVIDRALARGPQIITRRGRETAVLVSADDFRRLAAPSGDLVGFFRASPLAGLDLDLRRDPDRGREVDV